VTVDRQKPRFKAHESRVKTGTKDVHVTRRVALWGLTTTSSTFSAFLAEVAEPKEKEKEKERKKGKNGRASLL
jgi:hypothetical protein